jgi:hypothetical protein
MFQGESLSKENGVIKKVVQQIRPKLDENANILLW